jgi:hypothetical protein
MGRFWLMPGSTNIDHRMLQLNGRTALPILMVTPDCSVENTTGVCYV